ncbi:MAG: pilus assembly protein TadG-related protein [Stellaceae bacterium]
MFGPIIAVLASLRRLAGRREGNIAILFGLSAIPLVVGAGIAIDTVRAYSVKTQLGAALDAAALAVGSEVNQTQSSLTTYLNNYFAANYPASALGGATATVTAVPGNASLTAATVNFQATATVPMTFMQLVGVDNITVSATAQIKRTSGIELVLALDNTGSMLCGPHSGAPNYNNTNCSQNVITSDTNCTNASDQSRICTLMNASTNFVNILASAMTASDQLYIGVVPYVTTVNVGNSFCTAALSCGTHIATDCSGIAVISDTGDPIFDPNKAVAQPTTKLTGNTTKNSATITNVSSTTGLFAGIPITGTGIPGGATVSSVTATTITISSNATSTNTGETLTITGIYGSTNTTNTTVPVFPPVSTIAALVSGEVVTGTGIGVANYSGGYSPSTSISAVSTANNTITLCAQPSQTKVVELTLYPPLSYDTTHSQTTENWMGCVVEPTSSGENTGVAGVLNAAVADPDYTEPTAWPAWYAYWWYPGQGGTNSWTLTGGAEPILAQNNTTEILGLVTTDWDHFPGPNQGCPVPLLPLTSVSTNESTITSTISSMWPRDAGGTQVDIGAIWGWRVLSPNGPFTPNNGHPLSYATAASTAWLKVMVLMTDGVEEWPATTQFTGLGYIADGKIGTNSNTSTAVTNLATRLADTCTNMAKDGIIIYTVGLGEDGNEGANNTQLQNCPANGGYFIPANPSTLNAAFTQIAQSLLALRLSQ